MAEQTLLSEGDVVVTTTRFTVRGQTYAMSGVTSVKSLVQRAVKGPMLLMAFGVFGIYFMLTKGDMGVLFATVVFGGGGLLWWIKGVKYILVLNTASGEVQALVSRNKEFITRVVNALNEAIVQRG